MGVYPLMEHYGGCVIRVPQSREKRKKHAIGQNAIGLLCNSHHRPAPEVADNAERIENSCES